MKTLSRDIGAAIVGIVALAVMLGWVMHISLLVQIFPYFVPMQFNTALCFLLSASALFTITRQSKLSLALSLVVLCIVLTTLLEYLWGRNLGIDEWFIQHHIITFSTYPGRMSPNTAISFLLLNSAFLIYRSVHINTLYSHFCLAGAAITLIIALLSLLGYALNIQFIFSWGNITGMALHTALCFAILAISFLCTIHTTKIRDALPAIAIALAFSGFLLSWQYLMSNENQKINHSLRQQVHLIKEIIHNDLTRKQAAINRLSSRLNWLHSLNYNILKNNIRSYFRDFPSLLFIGLKTPEGKPYYFFKDAHQNTDATPYLKRCEHLPTQAPNHLICLHSTDQSIMSIFDEKRIFSQLIAKLPETDNLIVNISLEQMPFFTNAPHIKLQAHNWKAQTHFKVCHMQWKIVVGLTKAQVKRYQTLFPAIYFTLGVTISILLLFIFYYVGQVIIKNRTLHQNEKALAKLASKDHLTNVLNRKSILKILHKLFKKVQAYELAIMFIDLDDFKAVNDAYGHNIGDAVLISTSQRLRATIRQSDYLARFGGDEFIAILHSTQLNHENLSRIAQNMLQAFQRPIKTEDASLMQTISIGIALYTNPSVSADELIQCADTAMYNAKKLGKNNFAFYEKHLSNVILRQQQLSQSLRQSAPDYPHFYLCYQPQFNIDAMTPCGIEALIRWHHPQLGEIPADELIEIAEMNRAILPLGLWIMEKAMQDWHSIKAETQHAKLDLSINISPLQLAETSIVNDIQQLLQKTQFPAEYLILEVTETAMIKHLDNCLPHIQALKNIGVRFAIDDFGKGYSSISYLINIPADYVKIDKEFVINLDSNNTIVSTIITLVKKLNKQSVAEGVETEAHLTELNNMGCDKAQGYFFAKPLKLKALIKYFTQLD